MDPASVLFQLIAVLFLVLLNGFFVSAEFAMVKVRSTRIKTLAKTGDLRARLAKGIVEHLDAYLSACQLGITLASLGLGWIGEPAIATILEPLFHFFSLPEMTVEALSFSIAFTLITSLHIVLGELAPKSLAIQNSEKLTLWTAAPLVLFYKVMYPFIWLMNYTSNKLLDLLGLSDAGHHEAAHTGPELRLLLEESHRQGYIEQTELKLMDNVFDFSEHHAYEVMIPRTDMICLYIDKAFEENLDTVLNNQRTRYPVCEENKDTILGFIHIKDFLLDYARSEKPNLKKILRPVLAVPESMNMQQVLQRLQKHKTQMAIVIDEYGGTAGLITLRDILREIVGEFKDEFDNDQQEIERLEDNSYSLDGKLLIDEVNELLNLDLDSEDFSTLSGWLCSQTELPLEPHRAILYKNYKFILVKVDPSRVYRVIVRPHIQ